MIEKSQKNCPKLIKNMNFRTECGGKSGIRTHGRLTPTPVFKTGALSQLDHLSMCNSRLDYHTSIGHQPMAPKLMCFQRAFSFFVRIFATLTSAKSDFATGQLLPA